MQNHTNNNTQYKNVYWKHFITQTSRLFSHKCTKTYTKLNPYTKCNLNIKKTCKQKSQIYDTYVTQIWNNINRYIKHDKNTNVKKRIWIIIYLKIVKHSHKTTIKNIQTQKCKTYYTQYDMQNNHKTIPKTIVTTNMCIYKREYIKTMLDKEIALKLNINKIKNKKTIKK